MLDVLEREQTSEVGPDDVRHLCCNSQFDGDYPAGLPVIARCGHRLYRLTPNPNVKGLCRVCRERRMQRCPACGEFHGL